MDDDERSRASIGGFLYGIEVNTPRRVVEAVWYKLNSFETGEEFEERIARLWNKRLSPRSVRSLKRNE